MLIALIHFHLLLIGAANLPVMIAKQGGEGNIALDNRLQKPVKRILHFLLAVAAPEGDAVSLDLVTGKNDKIRLFPVEGSVHELERIRRDCGDFLQIRNLHNLKTSVRSDAELSLRCHRRK